MCHMTCLCFSNNCCVVATKNEGISTPQLWERLAVHDMLSRVCYVSAMRDIHRKTGCGLICMYVCVECVEKGRDIMYIIVGRRVTIISEEQKFCPNPPGKWSRRRVGWLKGKRHPAS